MKFNILGLVLLSVLGLSKSSPVEARDIQTTIKFDDISNASPVPDGYNNFIWTNWDVRSPDRSQPSYVTSPSPFQYGRVTADTVGMISREPNVASFVISKLRYGCSAPIPPDGFSPGVPKHCKVTVTANCANGHAQQVTAQFSPTQPIANMGTLNLAQAVSCSKAKSYTFTAVGKKGHPVDLLIDNIAVHEYSSSA